MNKPPSPAWLPSKDMPSSRLKLLMALFFLFIAWPCLGLWIALHDGDWMGGLCMVGIIYVPLFGYLGVRKLWRKWRAQRAASCDNWNR